MKYFLLHNRRHLGPYSLPQLKNLAAKNSIPLQAYVISEENSVLGKLNYQKLSEVIELRAQNQFEFDEKTVGGRTKIVPLPEEEVRFIEKTFNEAVDPLDLVGVPPPPPTRGEQSKPAALNPSVESKRWFEKIKSMPKQMQLGALMILGLLFLTKAFWGTESNVLPDRSPAVLNSQNENVPNSNSSSLPGASLSQSLRLGPAKSERPPSEIPSIRVPISTTPEPQIVEEPAVDVEENISQGETPEPSIIKRKSKKRRPASDENPNAEENATIDDPERDATHDADSEDNSENGDLPERDSNFDAEPEN